ncbi:MAG: phosphatase PAP2 family protein [Abditibacteriales bacterium]|nr:phosphatase PAP2 family protein [Abditibacteriales bacterium]MDW8366590.1 phosphatase PAP2 family protein [Abditibacteriales bacterium]
MMTRHKSYCFGLLVLFIAAEVAVPTAGWTPRADADEFAQEVSDSLSAAIALSVVVSLTKGKKGRQEAGEIVEAVFFTGLITDAIKALELEERPNRRDRKSFPSGHTSRAFALAAVLAEHYPKQKWLFYFYAALVAWSRVELREHYVHDVVAGGALGIGVGRYVARRGGIVLWRARW